MKKRKLLALEIGYHFWLATMARLGQDFNDAKTVQRHIADIAATRLHNHIYAGVIRNG